MPDLSDTPAGMIARLDGALARKGQTVKLRRRIGTSPTNFVDLSLKARVTGYGTTDLSQTGVKVTDSKFILSPTAIVAAAGAWPGAAGGEAKPRIGDFLVVEGRQRGIAQVDNIVIGDVWVRTEGRIS